MLHFVAYSVLILKMNTYILSTDAGVFVRVNHLDIYENELKNLSIQIMLGNPSLQSTNIPNSKFFTVAYKLKASVKPYLKWVHSLKSVLRMKITSFHSNLRSWVFLRLEIATSSIEEVSCKAVLLQSSRHLLWTMHIGE